MSDKVFATGRGMVHSWQCDHMGHVNIRAYGELFEQSIWHAFNQMGITPSLLRQGDIAMATVEQNIRYFKELLAGDVVYIESYIAKISEKSVTVEQKLYNAETDIHCASCTLTAVCIDPHKRKACPFPADIYKKGQSLLFNAP
ncbi:acyl-CoA thioesterase [Psychrobacter sp. I-STPA6b]|uniref:acyl-CoA thioesterase n=1 Tax=Psychrobacter sp. I-STPA6b TaxID=2585718 RepID=UPI001D0CDA0D|nr:thioesterase family protein [Psychrobacter sp. I-STPA6b]